MTLKQILLFCFSIAGILAVNTSCAYIASQQANNTEIIDHHTSQNALDWAGIYAGTLPCADCAGIATTVILQYDNTFELQMIYEGKSTHPFVDRGQIEWDKAGRTIRLIGLNTVPMQFQVGENILFLLDQEGQRIHGALAPYYLLPKIK
ncbi:copper resistance protein NlpE [Chrysiogenes arsenatis]|uniref:copper resistance protein NlpE n=1 Tax=Chrysiogenes arsenatis TaxID=309797 RepID=UPI0003F92E53|nr:copper resistance protein NlpE [Chrysiogenes arsenatis]